MIVLVILGLLVAVALPRLKGGFGLSRLKAASRQLTGALRYARNTAVFRGQPCEIVFMMEKGAYRLVLLDEHGHPEKKRRRSRWRSRRAASEDVLSDDVRGLKRLPKELRFSSIYSGAPPSPDHEHPRVLYRPDGTATPLTVTIQDGRDRALNVQVYRTTGMARVRPGQPQKPPKGVKLYYGPKER